MFFDTHAHYDDKAFDEDRRELLAELRSGGIDRVTDPGSTYESLGKIEKLVASYSWIYGAMGIHPSECGNMTETWIEEIRSRMKRPGMVAIGEIGLDYHWEEPGRDWQQHWFRRQLQLARELRKPVIIHSRDAAEDTLRILKEEKAEEIGGVIHCYSYSPEAARDFLKMGFYIGVGGVVTFKNGRKLKETVREVPLERIVLETDSPYLAPEPHRGERNCSLYLHSIAAMIAELKGISIEEVGEQTRQNALRLYQMDAE